MGLLLACTLKCSLDLSMIHQSEPRCHCQEQRSFETDGDLAYAPCISHLLRDCSYPGYFFSPKPEQHKVFMGIRRRNLPD